MKISNIISKIVLILIVISSITFISCNADENSNPIPTPPIVGNTRTLNLAAIDTAKVVQMSENGSNPLIVLNRKLNQNSYISDFCFSTDGTKFIYVDQQLSGTVPNLVKTIKLKIANANGSNDTDLFAAENPMQGSSITSIRFCSDGKIFFAYKMATSNGAAFGLNYKLINPDGSGLSDASTASFGEYFSVSNDRRYFSNIAISTGSNGSRWFIYDKTLDNGAGGVHVQVDFPTTVDLSESSISNDGKYAVLPYREANDIKLKIVDMITKVVATKTIITGINSSYGSFRFHIASDGVRGILTYSGENFIKSKSYIFNIVTGAVSSPFENNDENVLDVYAY